MAVASTNMGEHGSDAAAGTRQAENAATATAVFAVLKYRTESDLPVR